MCKSVYDLSRDQFDELKSAYFWSDDTPPENLVTAAGLPALFPKDIPDDVIATFYNDVSFVDDDFSSAPGIPWTDSRLGFYETTYPDGGGICVDFSQNNDYHKKKIGGIEL